MMPRTKLKGKKSSLALRWKQRVKAASQASQEHSLSDWSGVLTEVQSHDEFLSNLNTYYDHQKQENCLNYEKACTNVKMVFRNIQQQFPDRIKLVNVMKSCEEYSDDENNNPNTVATSSDRSRSHKLTEFKESCKSRSSSRKHLPSVTQTPTVLATVKKDVNVCITPSCLRTPLMSSRRLLPGATIKPKIRDSPITVMRRPIPGEIAVSMNGSPLMVGATSQDDFPTVNVPMEDGRVVSIMPEAGAQPDDLPYFDEATKGYLKTLQRHLKYLAPNTP
uniref:Borealin C-terminal domain-containing protein n=2 Tax=Graphocephala atropunctata TaxID=36148 RepID=A0A1B6MNW3_9HEMI